MAEQTNDFVGAFAKFLTNPQLRNELFIGGPPKPQERALAEGVDIVTGTPGEPHERHSIRADTHEDDSICQAIGFPV